MAKDTRKCCPPKPLRSPLQRGHPHSCNGRDPIVKLNNAIDAHQVPQGVNELAIESILHQWEQHGKRHRPQYWLLAARLFEMAILCAGHYVDNCEFTAAGDLLFNPRKILIHQRGCSPPLVKHRHGRLSDQLKVHAAANQPFPVWFKRHAATQMIAPAVLPYLLNRLEQSGRMAAFYLQAARERLQKAAATIGFLGAWSLSGRQELHGCLQAAAPATRALITDHGCAFDPGLFATLGKEIRLLDNDPDYRSDFIRSQKGPAGHNNSR